MIYSRNPDIKTTLMPDGHVVLFNTKTEWAQILNPMAALVWEFLDGHSSEAEIVSQIAELTNVDDIGKLDNDVNCLINDLVMNGLLHEGTAADARQG